MSWKQDTWGAVYLQILLRSGILKHSQCFDNFSKIQRDSAPQPLFAICFDKPVEECIFYLLFFVPTCLFIWWYRWWISVPVHALKWNVFLSAQLHLLLLYVLGIKLYIFKWHKLQFLQFLPCSVSTKKMTISTAASYCAELFHYKGDRDRNGNILITC